MPTDLPETLTMQKVLPYGTSSLGTGGGHYQEQRPRSSER
jgi:hypothetical protein